MPGFQSVGQKGIAQRFAVRTADDTSEGELRSPFR